MNGSIDTAVALPDGAIYAFAGDQVTRYRLQHGRMDADRTWPIGSAFPGAFPRDLDAALLHPDGSLYLFRGPQHIRYDLRARRPEQGYPRSYIRDWPGVFPNRVDAAIAWLPDVVYFFAEDAYISYSLAGRGPRRGYPKPIHRNWPGLGYGPVRLSVNLPNARHLVGGPMGIQVVDHEGWAVETAPIGLEGLLGETSAQDVGKLKSALLRANAQLEQVAAGKLRLGRPSDAAHAAPLVSEGQAVRAFQQALLQLGFALPAPGADGRFGQGTYNAVMEYKRRHNLTSGGQVDGIVGSGTIAHVDAALGAPAGTGGAQPAAVPIDKIPTLSGAFWTDNHGAGAGHIAGRRGLPDFSTARRVYSPPASGSAEQFDYASGQVLGPLTQGFGSAEHWELGHKGLQDMIDSWARAGLIAGGAFVQDTDADTDQKGRQQWVRRWQFTTPDYSQPLAPFGNVGRDAHWQWIVPNAHKSSNGERWTAATLKAEVVAGTAATLSIGDIVMMSGDLVEKFDDYKQTASTSWRSRPVNMIKGVAEQEPFAMTLIRLMQFPGDGIMDKLDDKYQLERCKNNYSEMQKRVRSPGPYWDRVKALVEFVRAARGKTGCSELTVVSRVMRQETSDLGSIEIAAPWLTDDAPKRLHAVFENMSNVDKDKRDKLSWEGLRRGGINLEVAQFILTNGYYGDLALRNDVHFTPLNWKTFEDAHRAALKMVDDLLQNPLPRIELAPIPADAIALTAFGMHFMTDAFSAGHMRVPRAELRRAGRDLLSKFMHDIDGKIGLNVTNGFGHEWRAFGDGYLFNRSDWQLELLKKLPRTGAPNRSVEANADRVSNAIAAAMKQLHYQAQKYLDEPSAQAFRDVLLANRGDSRGLAHEWSVETPGPYSGDRDAWIAMSAQDKIDYMRKHQPLANPSVKDFLHSASGNVEPLVLADASLDRDAGYFWESQYHDNYRLIGRTDVGGEVLDIKNFYHAARNMPTAALSWYGRSDTSLPDLFSTIKENVS